MCVSTVHQGVIPVGTSMYTLPQGIPNGIYIISIQGDNYKQTIKIVR